MIFEVITILAFVSSLANFVSSLEPNNDERERYCTCKGASEVGSEKGKEKECQCENEDESGHLYGEFLDLLFEM